MLVTFKETTDTLDLYNDHNHIPFYIIIMINLYFMRWLQFSRYLFGIILDQVEITKSQSLELTKIFR